ncbi:hypothetical protein PMSM_03365 [Paenibacillus macquariensis subsp. macquariensis]|uniref:Uncharacterized protein n=2 Tax=Paenibacillus macquariensis TaxID=948756 RepID=A0ABY1JMI9_9BACL|nr:hypothetical protein PMSM_03365 [Paenibacillus macquariensis subsp. macquariensis]SIQ46012.1 hypothetical protein SAMN05421578_10289 [Paenibacillus macquariensis]
MKEKLKKYSFLLILSLIFSLLYSYDESKKLYQKLEVNNYYGSLFLDIVVNFFSALFILEIVSRLNFFEYYRKFMMNYFNKKTGNFISFIVILILLFLLFLPIVLFIKPEYIVTFLGSHLLFVWIFLIDSFKNTETTKDNEQ